MIKLFVALATLLSFSAVADQSDPHKLDPAIAIVSTQIETRIVVYDVCSPQHCWSETYFQYLSSYPDKPEVLCTSKIKEIFVGHLVTDVSWKLVHNAPEIYLKVQASHGGFEPHTATLIPLDGCSYSIKNP